MRKPRTYYCVAFTALVVALSGATAGGQLRWTQRNPAMSPALRVSHAMAYDAARNRTVVFGGRGISGLMNDTWEWDGSTWTQCTPAKSPQTREYSAMAYDAARKRVVLFGGLGGSWLNDTWEWDGVTWTRRWPAMSPLGRYGHAMAYDAARKRVVVCGGSLALSSVDTWEWDGNSWVQRTPPTSPPTRVHHAMAYDAAAQRIVLFGGRGISTLTEMWEWDGNTWTQRFPATSPPGREGHAMAYDAARQRVFLFGGMPKLYTTIFNDTWEWDGNTWTQQSPTLYPAARFYHTMVYDSASQHIILYGGGNTIQLNDTWTFGYAGTILLSGSPRLGSQVSLTLLASGDAGRPYKAGSSLGTGPIRVDTRQVDLSPDGLLAVSLGGLWPGIFSGYQGVLDSAGKASAAIHIPSSPAALVGNRVHTAFITYDPAAPSGIMSISNTLSFTITK